MEEEMLMQETQPEVEAETEEETTEPEVTEESTEEVTEVQETVEETVDTSADDGEAEEALPPVVRVKFNKQERAYSLDEATPLVEKGLKWDSFKETHEKLKDLAAGYGVPVSALIDNLTKNADEKLYEQTLEECGSNEAVAKKLFAANKAERDSKIKAARDEEAQRVQREQEDEKTQLQTRLAADFEELQKEQPDKFAKFADVPQKVLDDSVKSGRSLYDAYLRYERAEARKSESVKVKQAAAAKVSTGSLNDGAASNSSPEIDAALNGIWGK